MFQGYPIAQIPETMAATEEKVLEEIAGNMMSGPLLLALLQSMLAAMPWRATLATTHTTMANVDDAMALYTTSVARRSSDDAVPPPPPPKRIRRRTIKHPAE